MELASIFINLGILAATVVAGIIALRAVNDARDARDEAADSERKAAAARDAAVSAAERSASAGERSAAALERQVALAESAAELPTWTLEREEFAGPAWLFTNSSGGRLSEIEIRMSALRSGEWSVGTVADPMAAGQSFRISSDPFDPAQCTVVISCVTAEGQPSNETYVIF